MLYWTVEIIMGLIYNIYMKLEPVSKEYLQQLASIINTMAKSQEDINERLNGLCTVVCDIENEIMLIMEMVKRLNLKNQG